jgi:hypothetical protein
VAYKRNSDQAGPNAVIVYVDHVRILLTDPSEIDVVEILTHYIAGSRRVALYSKIGCAIARTIGDNIHDKGSAILAGEKVT